MKNYSYITYLGSDDYLIGVLALNYQLKKYKSKYPLVVLTSHELSENTIDIIKEKGLCFMFVDKIKLSEQIIYNNKKMGVDNWNKTFEKLKLFGLISFKKIVYLDADMLILNNLDHLFNEKNLSSVISGTKYPGNEDWPQTLNSGLIVIVPKKNEDKRLISLIGKGDMKNAGGDQGVIHAAYPNWPEQKELHLSENYNLLAPYESYYLSKGIIDHSNLNIVHYIGSPKPWNFSFTRKNKYILREIYKAIFKNHSIKGIKYTINDFLYYYSLCKKIKQNLHKF